MKKILPFIIATVLLIGSSAFVIAQNHRHNHNDQNMADSLVSEAIENSTVSDGNNNNEEVLSDAIEDFNKDFSYNHNDSNTDFDDEGIAKLAIVMVFGTLIVLFMAPVLIVAIILYYIYKRKQSKDRITMAAIDKGVEIPSEKPAPINNAQGTYNTAEKEYVQPVKKEKPLMERGIMKVAIGIGLCCMAKIIHIDIIGAAAIFIAIYGIGQIIIAYIYRNKEQ